MEFSPASLGILWASHKGGHILFLSLVATTVVCILAASLMWIYNQKMPKEKKISTPSQICLFPFSSLLFKKRCFKSLFFPALEANLHVFFKSHCHPRKWNTDTNESGCKFSIKGTGKQHWAIYNSTVSSSVPLKNCMSPRFKMNLVGKRSIKRR